MSEFLGGFAYAATLVGVPILVLVAVHLWMGRKG